MEMLYPHHASELYLGRRAMADNLRRRAQELRKEPDEVREGLDHLRRTLHMRLRNLNRARAMMDEDSPYFSHHTMRSPMQPDDQDPANGVLEPGQPSQEPDQGGLQNQAAAAATAVSDEVERDLNPSKSKPKPTSSVSDEVERDVKPKSKPKPTSPVSHEVERDVESRKSNSRSPVSDESDSESGSTESEGLFVGTARESAEFLHDIAEGFRRLLKRPLPSKPAERKSSKGARKHETDTREKRISPEIKEIMVRFTRKNNPKPSPNRPDDERLQSKVMRGKEEEENEEELTSQDTSDEEDIDETDSEVETTQEFISDLTKDEEDLSEHLLKSLKDLESQRDAYTNAGLSVERKLQSLEELRSQTGFLLMTLDPFQDLSAYRDLQHQAQRQEAEIGRLKNVFGVLDSLLSALHRYSDQVQGAYHIIDEDIRRNLGHSLDDEPEELVAVEESK